jgi:hypothetical protein
MNRTSQEQPRVISQTEMTDVNTKPLSIVFARPKSKTNGDESVPANYALYVEEKKCYNLQKGRSEVEEEISELRLEIAQNIAGGRAFAEKLLEQKQQQLAEMTKCLRGRDAISNKYLSQILADAARSGDPDAQVEYAKDPQIDTFQAANNLQALREWRDNAPRYLDSAIRAGNSEAMMTMAEASDPFRCAASQEAVCADLLTHVIAEDARVSYTYYYLAQITNGASTPIWVSAELRALEHILTDAEIEIAKRNARSMKGTYLD